MRRSLGFFFVTLIVLAALLQVAVRVSAQAGFPLGYEIVYNAPEANMHPRDYNCNMTVYDASSGALVKTSVPAVVDGYVIWHVPSRPADYYVSFQSQGSRAWLILNRETLDAICK